jgi:hypothetical protein
VPAIVANLYALEANPTNPVIFNGASRYSDDPEKGKAKLETVRTQDREHCLCRKTDAVADMSKCTAAVMSSPVQLALASDDSIPCLVTDDTGACTCRQTDAVADVTKCTDLVMASAAQHDLRAETKVTCLKYDDTIEGMFRTPSLLNIGETAPYFHSGAVQTLEDVVWFYNQGGGPTGTFAGTKSPQIRPLGLSDDEVHDLAEFLRSLTGKSPAQQAAEARQAKIDKGEDPNEVWDWSKNTSKPSLTGAGGAPASGSGGSSGAKGGSSGGMAGAPGAAGGPAGAPGAAGGPAGAPGTGGMGGGA